MKTTIIVALCVSAVCAIIGGGVIAQERAEMAPIKERAARLDYHCASVRERLVMELGFAFGDAMHQRLATLMFRNHELDDWRGIALCVPEGVPVGHGCAEDDMPCMAATVTRAIASLR